MADVDLESQSETMASLLIQAPKRSLWRCIYVLIKARGKFSTVGLEARARASLAAPLLQATATTDSASSESEQTSITTHASQQDATLVDIIIVGEANASSSDATLGNERPNIAEIVKDKTRDVKTLQESGGVHVIAELLNTDLATGISGDETDIRRRRFREYSSPPAVAKEASSRSFLGFLFWYSNDWTVILLVITAALYTGFGIKNNGPKTGWYIGVFVLIAAIVLVLAPTMHDVWFNHMAQKRRLVDLLKGEPKAIDILRGGVIEKFSVSEVVLGDIVMLTKDSLVPADGVFIDGEDLVVSDGLEMEINEEESPLVLYGSTVSHGRGRMLVTAVGTGTVLGEAMSKLTDSDKGFSRLPSQLDKLRKVTHIASLLITIPIIVVLSLGLTLGGPGHGAKPSMPEMRGRPAGSKEFMDIIQRLVVETSENMGSVKAPLGLLMLGVLEGMPFVIALAAFYWKWKMLSDKASVPGLLDCVKLGSAATIFTDKTPLNSTAVAVCVIGCDDDVTVDQLGSSGIVRDALCDGIRAPLALAVPSSHGGMEDPLLAWAASNLDMKLDELRQSRTIMKTKRLNSDEEGSGVLMKKRRIDEYGHEEHDVYAHWKGPATTILGRSSTYYDKNGEVESFDAENRKSFETVIERIERDGLQAMGFAYKQSPTLEDDGWTLIAILGLKKDTCSPQTIADLKALTDADVSIVLVSDDDAVELKETAIACGIFPQDGIAITGLEFQELDENQKMDKVDKISVMGNASPSDRLSLMQWRKKKEKDCLVIVLGTRTSDAPLLKEANLGVAMGGWSSNTAKESADIIVLDGTLTSLLAVVRCGGCTHLNIQKYVQVELVTNIAGTLIASITTLSLGSTPITGFQLIWATLIMAVVAGPALLLEPPRGVPAPQSAPLISKPMWRNIVVQVSYQTAVLLGLAFGFRGKGGFVNKSVIFNAFVLCQLFNLVNSREMEKVNVLAGLHRDGWILSATVAVVALQVCFVQVSSYVAGNEKLGFKQWGFCFLIGLGSCPVDFSAKCLSNLVKVGSRSNMAHSASTDSIENLELPLMS